MNITTSPYKNENFNYENMHDNLKLYKNVNNNLDLVIDSKEFIYNPNTLTKTKKRRGRKKQSHKNFGIEMSEIRRFLNHGSRKESSKVVLEVDDFKWNYDNSNNNSNYTFNQTKNEENSNIRKNNSNGAITLIWERSNSIFFLANPKIEVEYANNNMKFTAKYNSPTKIKFDYLKVKTFSSFNQNMRLFKHLSNSDYNHEVSNKSSENGYFLGKSFAEDYLKSNIISSFTIFYSESQLEKIFNFKSNFKINNRFAILENKTNDTCSLILVDSSSFFSFFLPGEYCVISINNSLLQDELSIVNSNNFAVLKNVEIDIERDKKLVSLSNIYNVTNWMFLDLNDYEDSEKANLISLKNENMLKSNEICNLNRKIENLIDENNTLVNRLIEKEAAINNLTHLNEVLTVANKKISDTSNENKQFESSFNSFFCVKFMNNVRNSVFIDCGHIINCYECNIKVMKSKRKAASFFPCPICNKDNPNCIKLLFG